MTINISTNNIQANITPLVPNSQNSASSGISFSDIFDAANPLQHIPLVSSAYRSLSGNSISTFSKLVGDTIYGLPLAGGSKLLSVASSVADAAIKELSGKDMTDNILSIADSATNSNSSFQLIPNQNPSSDDTNLPSSANFFESLRNPKVAAGQYNNALAIDNINKALVKTIA
ncbi:MAG: hypothetical protein WCJ33_01655 [Pseudomonadota bacterium]